MSPRKLSTDPAILVNFQNTSELKSLWVQRSLLCRYSERFDEIFLDRTRNLIDDHDTTNALIVRDVDVKIIRPFIRWLRRQSIPSISSDRPDFLKSVDDAITLYSFALDYKVPRLQKHLVLAVKEYFDTHDVPPEDSTIIYAFKKLPGGDALRGQIVDSHCYFWSERGLTASESTETEALPDEFKAEVISRTNELDSSSVPSSSSAEIPNGHAEEPAKGIDIPADNDDDDDDEMEL